MKDVNELGKNNIKTQIEIARSKRNLENKEREIQTMKIKKKERAKRNPKVKTKVKSGQLEAKFLMVDDKLDDWLSNIT